MFRGGGPKEVTIQGRTLPEVTVFAPRKRTKDEVRELQKQLINLGYLSDAYDSKGNFKEVDGVYGPKTAAAHRKLMEYGMPEQRQRQYSPTSIRGIMEETRKKDEEVSKGIMGFMQNQIRDIQKESEQLALAQNTAR